MEVANLLNIAGGTGGIKTTASSDTSVASGDSSSFFDLPETRVSQAGNLGSRLAVDCCQGCSTNLVRQRLFMTAMSRLANKNSAVDMTE